MAKFAHRLASEHELLSKTEVSALLKELECTLDQLPFIDITDAAIQLMIQSGDKVVPGSVIRITRPSMSVGTEVYYRLVIIPYEGLL